MEHPSNLFQLFLTAATQHTLQGILYYSNGDLTAFRSCSYGELKDEAWKRSLALTKTDGFRPGQIVLIHFTAHIDNILWFWATLFAGGTPAMSTPLAPDLKQRRDHLHHLFTLFQDPLCITQRSQSADFASCQELRVMPVEDIDMRDDCAEVITPIASPNDLAALMLTSGSTGQSKAVCLTHGQILASVRGKSAIVDLPQGCSFLNWVGVDHVAGLLETHLEAMFLGRDQIHVPTGDMISEPFNFLQLIDRHRVGRTFAPNFFLVSLVQSVASADASWLDAMDLSCLRCLVSGGEANPLALCTEIARSLSRLGTPDNVLFPGFGMTETCAGSIYNTNCPAFDSGTGMEFASLGRCVTGIEVTIQCFRRRMLKAFV